MKGVKTEKAKNLSSLQNWIFYKTSYLPLHIHPFRPVEKFKQNIVTTDTINNALFRPQASLLYQLYLEFFLANLDPEAPKLLFTELLVPFRESCIACFKISTT